MAYACSDWSPKARAIARPSRVRATAPSVTAPPDSAGRRSWADQRQPRQRGEDGEDRPHAQPGAPAAERLRDRHRQHERGGQADRQRGRVERGDDADPVGEVQLDQRREQHVGRRHPGERQHRQQEEDGRRVGQHATAEPDDHADQTPQRHAVDPDRAGQPRRQGTERREGEHRQRREQAGQRHGEREPLADLGQDRTHGHRGRAQVERERPAARRGSAAVPRAGGVTPASSTRLSTRPQSRGEVSSSTMRTARWSETADVRCSPATGVKASSCRTKSIRRRGSAAGTVSPSSTPTTGHGSRSRQSVSSGEGRGVRLGVQVAADDGGQVARRAARP